MVVDDRRFHLQAQVLGDIEHREFRIDIGINHRECIDTDQTEETQIAPTAVFVLAFLEDVLVTLALGICRDLHAEMQELVVTLRVWVVIRQVQIGLGIVYIHGVVPTHGINATHESAIDQRQFPVLAVVDLSTARDDQCQPQGTLGVRRPGGPVFGEFQLFCRVVDDNRRTVFLEL